MSRISNELAGQISLKLTEKSKIAAENLHIEYRELVTKLYEDQTPQEVRDCCKQHAEWFHNRTMMILDGHGFRWERVITIRAIIPNKNGEAIMNLNGKIAERIVNAKRKWEKAKKEYEDLKGETKQALITLKTFSNIRKELPEAAPMLPPPLSNSLIVNFDSLHKKLSKQPEVIKKETTVQ